MSVTVHEFHVEGRAPVLVDLPEGVCFKLRPRSWDWHWDRLLESLRTRGLLPASIGLGGFGVSRAGSWAHIKYRDRAYLVTPPLEAQDFIVRLRANVEAYDRGRIGWAAFDARQREIWDAVEVAGKKVASGVRQSMHKLERVARSR